MTMAIILMVVILVSSCLDLTVAFDNTYLEFINNMPLNYGKIGEVTVHCKTGDPHDYGTHVVKPGKSYRFKFDPSNFFWGGNVLIFCRLNWGSTRTLIGDVYDQTRPELKDCGVAKGQGHKLFPDYVCIWEITPYGLGFIRNPDKDIGRDPHGRAVSTAEVKYRWEWSQR